MQRNPRIFGQISVRQYAIIALILVHLLPVWIFKYFPSQDGASHVYNAYILKEYHNPAMYKTRECFKLNLTLFPNWFSHVFMAGLMFVAPALVAEKILLSLCIGLAPISLFYYLRAVNGEPSKDQSRPGNHIFGFSGFLFAYNYLLHMGFYNFALSFPIFFFALGYWWKNHESMSAARIGLLYLLLTLLYFCHIVSYGLILVTLSICALWVMFKKPRKLLAFAGYMLPAGFTIANYLLHEARDRKYEYFTSEQLRDFFFKTKSLVYFNKSYIWISYILLGLVALFVIWTIWRDKIQARKWVARRDVFLIISVVFVAMYFKMPRFIGTGGWINERIHLFYIPILLPWLNADLHRILRWAAVGIMILLSLCHLGYTCRDYYGFNREMDDFTAAVGTLPDHVVFGRTEPDDWGNFKWQSIPHLASFFYYGMEGDRPYINNYEAEFNYFPFNFKGENMRDYYAGGIIDYYLVWNTKDDSPELEQYRKDYDIVYSNPRFKILQHKYRSQDAQVWEKYAGDAGVLNFQMRSRKEPDIDAQDGSNNQNTKLVFADTRYQPGGFGWDTVYPRYDFAGGVWDTEDAVFRLDLPNGDYEVTCQFRSNDGKSHRIDLYVNGKRTIRKLTVTGDEKVTEAQFSVEVSSGTLIQIIHAAGREHDAHWAWREVTVRRSRNLY